MDHAIALLPHSPAQGLWIGCRDWAKPSGRSLSDMPKRPAMTLWHYLA
jgi:hypothetical protein